MTIRLQSYLMVVTLACFMVEQVPADTIKARLINWTSTKPREGPPIYVCIYSYSGHQFEKMQRHVCESITSVPDERDSSSYGMMLTDMALDYLQKLFN